MTPVGLYSASREPDLPLGTHGAYKWSWCFIWGLLSAGGLQPLANTSYKAQWHTELCCLYIDITMHAQLILCISHLFHILYMHTAHLMSLIYAYILLMCCISNVHTSTLSSSLSYTCRNSCFLFGSAGVVIIHGRETGDEQSVASSLITLDVDP